ncbi:MAG: PAS domain S-box protein [Candidatus Omnitrophica bacterium]|nr:PAS domain S-box protein [Candidatus Omnitrophota bacterium]
MSLWNTQFYVFNLHAAAPAAASILLLVLGISAVIKSRASLSSIIFCVLTFCGMLWLISYAGMYSVASSEIALRWVRIEHTGVVFIPFFLYLFAAVMVRMVSHLRWFIFLAALTTLFFWISLYAGDWFIAGVYQYPWGYYPRYGAGGGVFVIFFTCLVVSNLRLFWFGFRQAVLPGHKKLFRNLFIAFSIAQFGAIDFLPTFGIPVYPFGYIPIMVFIAILSHLIKHYQLSGVTLAFASEYIVNAMTDILLVIDRDGRIRIANPVAANFFGVPAAYLRGKSIGDFFHDPMFDQGHFEKIVEHGGVEDSEIMISGREGKEVCLCVSIFPMQDRQKDVIGFVCLAKDITLQKQAQETILKAHEELELRVKERTQELELANEKLKKLDEMKSNFVMTASHEVRTPLTSIKGYISLLLQGKTGEINPMQKEFLGHVQKAASRLERLLSELLSLSKIEAGQTFMNIQPTDLSVLLREETVILKAEADLKRIGLNCTIEGDSLTIPCDEDKIREMIGNFISNALKYTPAGGAIEVKVRALPDFIEIEVSDTGIGIPEADIPRIFEPFHHAQHKGLHGEESSGLGLALAYKIIEAHHGTIWVKSQEGAGTTFFIRLPTSTHQKIPKTA